jgi:uncharacterized membrane protein
VTASTAVEISAPPERVWEVMTDVERWPSWTASVTSVTRLDDGPLRVGARARIRQPRLSETTWTVTELRPGESFTWVATSPGVRITAEHQVRPAPSGAVVTLSVTQEGLLARLMSPFLAGLTDRYLAMEAAGLKARSEEPT